MCAAMFPGSSIAAPAESPTGSRASQPAASGVTGIVTAARSRWSERGDRIFTDVDIRLADGSVITVRQPGGTVGDIGMVQFPGPPLLRAGDEVEARVAAVRGVWSVVEITALARYGEIGAPESVTPSGGVRSLGRAPIPMEYVRTTTDEGAPLYWESGCVYLAFDKAGTSHVAGDLEFTVMKQVLDHWRDTVASCSYMQFVPEEREGVEVGFDGVNLVKFRDESWCRPSADGAGEECHPPDAAGITTLTFINNPKSERYGEILDGDIELNGATRFSISVEGRTEGPADRCLADLANTFTHEVGHLLGLDHTCRFSGEPLRQDDDGNPVPLCSGTLSSEILDATMHPSQTCGETKKASLEADDGDAVCNVYALDADPDECKRVSLTTKRSWCTIAPGAGTRDSLLATFALLLGAVALLWRLRHVVRAR
jgi:hypothetical protein